jgi:hypothetical protein
LFFGPVSKARFVVFGIKEILPAMLRHQFPKHLIQLHMIYYLHEPQNAFGHYPEALVFGSLGQPRGENIHFGRAVVDNLSREQGLKAIAVPNWIK